MDPEGTVGKATSSKLEEMKSQRIPSFRDYLTIAKEHNQVVLWDFKHMKLNNTVRYRASEFSI